MARIERANFSRWPRRYAADRLAIVKIRRARLKRIAPDAPSRTGVGPSDLPSRLKSPAVSRSSADPIGSPPVHATAE